MMKKYNMLFLVLAVFAVLAGCHKDGIPDKAEPKVTELTVVPAQTGAVFSWKVEMRGKYQTCIEVSGKEDMTDAQSVEATENDGKYEASVGNLLPDTAYYYRVVVWNKFMSYKGEQDTFSTLAADPEIPDVFTVSLVADPAEGGTMTGGGDYLADSVCTVTATANEGYCFVNWTENDEQVSTDAEYTFSVTADRNLVAHFSSQAYTITAIADPTAGGTVSGSGGYDHGDECRLTATATEGYRFVNWTKNDEQVSADSAYTFTVTETATYIAHFQKKTYTVSVATDPEAGGTVTGGGTFEHGQSCTVKATANEGFVFQGWSIGGGTVTEASEYTFSVTGDCTLTATFAEVPPGEYVISVEASPTDGGTVSGGGTYTEGSQVTLTATANEGYTFTQWQDGNTSNPRTITVTGDATYTATFARNVYTITVSANPSNGGTVSGGGQYEYGDTCTLRATAATGYTFSQWQDGNTNNPRTITVTGNATYTAYFTQQTISDQTFTVNGVSFTMKRVEGGTFWMGAQSTNSSGQNYDSEAYDSESPVHSVTLSTFYMGETEVTQELWQAVMGSNPSHFSGTYLPVEMVSWNMIVNEFLPALNAATGQNFRLPTEAEWEYAARGGNQGHGYKYAGSNTIGNVAWYNGNSNSQTHPVATKSPNELGIYDMSGNVWEWCSDWYGTYSSGSQTNPQGPSSGSSRVLRGGCWFNSARSCRVSRRFNGILDYTGDGNGFRLALPQ